MSFLTLLINPPTPPSIPNRDFMLPQGLLYLASYLRSKNESVALLDCNVIRNNTELSDDELIERLLTRISELGPGLIGFGCLFSGQFAFVLKCAAATKRRFPQIPISIGGMHPSIFSREILTNCPFIDWVALGEGEHQLYRLVRWHKGEISSDEELGDGIAFRRGDSVEVRPMKSWESQLDNLPFPAYEIVDLKDYWHDTSHWHNPRNLEFRMTIPFISSRSCPYRCNFCSMFMVGGPRFRSRSPVNVVDEIQMLVDRFGCNHINFMDDNLTLDKKRAMAICELLVARNVVIQFETLNGLMIRSLDAEVIDALVAAGWVRGAIAIESGSDYIRNKIIKKQIPRDTIFRTISNIRRHPRVYLKAYFVLGLPEETNEMVAESYEMASAIDVDDVYVTNIVPYPGTALYQQARRDNLFAEDFDPATMWRDENFYMTNKNRFYIKPYQMSLDELRGWRARFDQLMLEKRTQSQGIRNSGGAR